MKQTATIVCAALAACLSQTAAAYVGPGAGLSLLGALWGLLLAVGACVGFIVLWPLRRYLRRRAEARQALVEEVEEEPRRDAARR
jgi:hypothetical protein